MVALAVSAHTAAASTATTTLLTASPSTTNVGQYVRLTATVSPVPTGGTVSFRDNGGPITNCGAVAVSTSTGAAVCYAVWFQVGYHQVAALYSGAGGFQSSGSITLRITVGKYASTASTRWKLPGHRLTVNLPGGCVPRAAPLRFDITQHRRARAHHFRLKRLRLSVDGRRSGVKLKRLPADASIALGTLGAGQHKLRLVAKLAHTRKRTETLRFSVCNA
jgi:hypothetical protein